MSDYCCLCETRRPAGGTNHLILNGGELWIEFCTPCGEKEILRNPETGEEISVADLMRRGLERDGKEIPPNLQKSPDQEPIDDLALMCGESFPDRPGGF